jgi:hypothetical protein
MKVFKINDETGLQVETEQNSNSVTEESTTTSGSSQTKEVNEGQHEPPPSTNS